MIQNFLGISNMDFFLKFIQSFILSFNFSFVCTEKGQRLRDSCAKNATISLNGKEESLNTKFILIFLTVVCRAKVTKNEKWPSFLGRWMNLKTESSFKLRK